MGWILIVLGVGGEFWYEARVSRADGWIQEFNSILSRKQQADLIVLGDITATARSDAKLASDASTKAIEGASSAVKLSTDAESHLKGALSKAEEVATLAKGYEQGIQDAKRDASEAKALLAEARQLALEARSGVARIQTPRSLQNTHSMSLRLAEFKGTEYTFSEVCPDKECNDLLKSIDSLLMAADWKRVKPPTGFPAINVYGSNQDLAVPESLIPGIRVAIESPTPFPGDLVLGKSPRYVQASVALRDELVSNLLPAAIPEDAPLVNRDKEGGSQTIRIAVGRKP